MKDSFKRDITYLRISVTELCNLRCGYCMPAEGLPKKSHMDMLRYEEILDAAKAAVSLGITKIRITGGEPLVKKGIIDLCKDIAAIDGLKELCVTTNGTLLEEMAQQLKDAGVNRINLSLDTLNPEKFKKITRTGDFASIQRGMAAMKKANFDKVKINTVLIGGFNDDEIEDFVNLTLDDDIEVRFIELMPIGDNLDFKGEFISCDEVLKKMPALEPVEKDEAGVATLYKLPEGKGKVGLIRPISCDFCEECNKIRLTADGKIKPCLHLEDEHCLKGEDYEGMRKIIEESVLQKPERRKELGEGNLSQAGRNMNQIGG